MEFSDKLKELRKRKGITQEELANSVFVSRSVIAKYESGNVMPTQENAEKLAVFFGVKLSYLIDEEEQVKVTLSELKARKIISYTISLIGLLINLFYLVSLDSRLRYYLSLKSHHNLYLIINLLWKF